jgi:hypothetical protein
MTHRRNLNWKVWVGIALWIWMIAFAFTGGIMASRWGHPLIAVTLIVVAILGYLWLFLAAK